MTINKAGLVAKGYNQEKGINFNKTFAPIARLEVILILLTFPSHTGIQLFWMDVNCAFLNDFLNKKVYIKQP